MPASRAATMPGVSAPSLTGGEGIRPAPGCATARGADRASRSSALDPSVTGGGHVDARDVVLRDRVIVAADQRVGVLAARVVLLGVREARRGEPVGHAGGSRGAAGRAGLSRR